MSAPSATPKKRALVLAHEPDGGASQIQVRLEQRGFDVDTHIITHDYAQPNVHVPLPSIEGYDLLVPMGSVRTLTDTTPIDNWVHDELAMIADAHESGLPVLGICFGGQLISTALGGSVEVSPVTEIGWVEISDGDAPNPVGPGPWLEWHTDRFDPPPGAVTLARNEVCEQLFQIGTTVGTQFHPEIDVAHMREWLVTVDDEYVEEHHIDKEALMAETVAREADNIAQCHRLVDWYLDEVVGFELRAATETTAGSPR